MDREYPPPPPPPPSPPVVLVPPPPPPPQASTVIEVIPAGTVNVLVPEEYGKVTVHCPKTSPGKHSDEAQTKKVKKKIGFGKAKIRFLFISVVENHKSVFQM
jgi:hypothetical protein